MAGSGFSHQAVLIVNFLFLVTFTLGVPLTRTDPWWGSALSDAADEGHGGTSGTEGYELVGMCKATCIQDMLTWPPTDKQCLDNDQCVVCWQMCELLYQAEHKWRQTCADAECSFGCTLACKFDFVAAKPGVIDSSWEFPAAPVTNEESASSLTMTWPRPQRVQTTPTEGEGVVQPVFVVYTLLFSDDNHAHWSKATSTANTGTQVTGDHTSMSGLRFMLLASTTRGTISISHPPYPGVKVDPTTTTTKAPLTTAPHAAPGVRPLPPVAPIVPSWDPSMFTDNTEQQRRRTGSDLFPDQENLSGRVTSLSVYPKPLSDGTLVAQITWDQELLTSPSLVYDVTWVRQSCDVRASGPPCHLGEEEVTAQIPATDTTVMQVAVAGLTYNSQYRLYVSLSGDAPEQVVFYTPVCEQPQREFTVCPTHRQTTTSTPTTTTSTSTTTTGTTTTRTASTTGTSVPTVHPQEDTVKKASSQEFSQSGWMGNHSVLVVLTAAVSVSTVLVACVGIALYTRFCRRPSPNEEMLKAMQSYASLPLIHGTPSQAGSTPNLHNLHQQALLQASLLQHSSAGSTPMRPGHALPALGHAQQLYYSMDGLNTSSIGLPQPPPLPPLPPLRNIHLGVSSVLQTPPTETIDHASFSEPAESLTPRMGTSLRLTENPFYNMEAGLLPQGAGLAVEGEELQRRLAALAQADEVTSPLHNPRLAALVAARAEDVSYRSRSMESLNKVSAGLGLPQLARQATSTADLVLTGWDRHNASSAEC